MNVLASDGWRMQWRRVERSFTKLSRPYNDTERYDDDIYHFFQDALHLKDWIKNDRSLPKGIRDQVEGQIENVRALRIAADFANGTKHMVRSWSRRENAQFTLRKVTVSLGDPKASGLQERVLTLADGTQITTEILAKEVMAEWKLLLSGWSLIP